MDKKLYVFSIGLSFLGLLVSIYMTIYKITSNNALCLGSGDCSTVNASPYSEVYGIPVALIGVFGYGLILLFLYFQDRAGNFFNEYGLIGTFGITLTGFSFNIYLIYVEAFVLKALCPFCLISQIAMTLLFFTTVIRLIRQPVN